MKLKKLDMRGITHGVMVAGFVTIFAIAGVAYMVASHAASCTNYYRITALSGVTVRQGRGSQYPSSGMYFYNNTVSGPNGGVSGGWTQVATPGSGTKGGVGYIPDQSRVYLRCN